MGKACSCRVCSYSDEVHYHLSALPEPQRSFFNDMYDTLCHTEMDLDYYKMKIADGELVFLSAAEQIMLKIMMSEKENFLLTPDDVSVTK